jgi:polyhydroxyalkanoate synthesis repressor PhaR
MAKTDGPVTIKKYANRRLYNTGTSTYVTLEDLATMVKNGEEFAVSDAKTGEDITRSVLTQIIFEQENKEGGENLLPIKFLRQLIGFYGGSMQKFVPSYLEVSLETFTREQEKLRQQMTQAFGATPFGPMMEEQVRRNMDMFKQAFSMFTPFAQRTGEEPAAASGDAEKPAAPASSGSDLEELRKQLADMQKKMDKLGGGS